MRTYVCVCRTNLSEQKPLLLLKSHEKTLTSTHLSRSITTTGKLERCVSLSHTHTHTLSLSLSLSLSLGRVCGVRESMCVRDFDINTPVQINNNNRGLSHSSHSFSATSVFGESVCG